MPLYRITAPNGQTYQIEGPEGASDADVASAVMAQYPEAGNASPKQSTIGSELKRGAQQIASSMQTAYGALAGSPEEAALRGLERSNAIGQIAGEGVGFEPVKKAYQERGLLPAAGEAISQIPRALAGQAANFATLAGGARLGAMAGSAFGPAGTIGGGILGAGAAMYPQFFGSNVESQASAQMERGEPVKIDRTKAGLAAAGQAALEGAGTAFTLGKGVVKGVLGIVDDAAVTSAKAARQLEATAQRSLMASAGRGAVRGAAAEMPVEVAQQVIERAQAGQDLTSPEAFAAYGEAAYQAGLVGGPLGGVSNVVTRGQAQDQVAAKARADAEIAAANAPKPGPQLATEAPKGTQGTLFTPEEMGPAVTPAAAPTPTATPKAEIPEGQGDLGLDFARTATDATLERERLKQLPQTPEVKARIQELNDQLLLSSQSEVEAIRAANETQAAKDAEDALLRKKFPGLVNAPDLMGATDEVKARTQGELFPAEELGGQFAGPQVPAKGLPPAEAAPEGKAPYQYKLPLRTVREGRTPNRNLEIPARPGELTPQNIMDTGVPISPVVRTWAETNLIGKTTPEVQRMVDKDPTLIEGKGQRAKLLRELLAPQPATFEEPTNGQTAAPTPPVQPRDEPRASEPSVGVSNEPAAPVVPQPRPRVPRATGAPAAPVGLGLVPSEQPAGEGITAQGTQPAPVINEAPATPPAPVVKPAPAATVTKAPKAQPAPAVATETVEEEAARKAEAEAVRKALATPPKKTTPPPAAPAPVTRTAPPEAELPRYDVTAAQTEQGLANPFDMIAQYKKRKAKAEAGRESVATAKGQSLESLKKSIASAKGPLGHALRRMVKSGKVKIEEAHPSDRPIGGHYDGSTVTLYANGIPEGKILPVALHEVAAHMGMAKMLGQEMYDNVGSRIMEWVQKGDGSFASTIAQRAYKRIPIRDMKRGPEVFQDELVAYFIEEMAIAESNGELPKVGPIRALWTRIKTALAKAFGTELKTDINPAELTPESIYAMAHAAFVEEGKTGPTKGETPKDLMSVSYTNADLTKGAGPLDAVQKSALDHLLDGAKSVPTGLSRTTMFRTQTADIAATLEHRLREKFDGAVRNSLGEINPMGLYRQAQDYTKLLLDFFQQGSLVKDPTLGLWRVTENKNVAPPAKVYELIDAYGKKNGYSRDEATQIASRVLEAVRLNQMRLANKNDATKFVIHKINKDSTMTVSYTHLTLPTNREV